MRVSNSKLTALQKRLRRDYKQDMATGFLFSFPQYRATVAMVPEFEGSKMWLVSVSIASETEKKFRRKVGEYHALSNLFHEYEFIKVTAPHDHESFAANLALIIESGY